MQRNQGIHSSPVIHNQMFSLDMVRFVGELKNGHCLSSRRRYSTI